MNTIKSFQMVVVGLFLLSAGSVFASHIPGGAEPVEYDGSALPPPVTGSIGFLAPVDGYDWYCAQVTTGQQVDVTLTRTSGDLLLNGGALSGLAPAGGTFSDISAGLIVSTSNFVDPDVSYSFTPTSSEIVTLFVSTWDGQDGGDYSMTVTGATAASCVLGGAPAFSVPSLSIHGLILLTLLFAIVALLAVRRFA